MLIDKRTFDRLFQSSPQTQHPKTGNGLRRKESLKPNKGWCPCASNDHDHTRSPEGSPRRMKTASPEKEAETRRRNLERLREAELKYRAKMRTQQIKEQYFSESDSNISDHSSYTLDPTDFSSSAPPSWRSSSTPTPPTDNSGMDQALRIATVVGKWRRRVKVGADVQRHDSHRTSVAMQPATRIHEPSQLRESMTPHLVEGR